MIGGLSDKFERRKKRNKEEESREERDVNERRTRTNIERMKESRRREGKGWGPVGKKKKDLVKVRRKEAGRTLLKLLPPTFFSPPAVLCNSSLKISGKRSRRSINKHKGRRGEKGGKSARRAWAVATQVKKEEWERGHLDVDLFVHVWDRTRGNGGKTSEGEKPGRDGWSMCLLFSRQPRERCSSAASLTLSPPEGSRAGSPQPQWKKQKRKKKQTKKTHTHTSPHWLHCIHTLVTA